MSTSELRHIAVIHSPSLEFSGDPVPAVLASCDRAVETAGQAYALVPDLQTFSWLSPGLDRLLSRTPPHVAAAACAAGARALAAATASLGAALRVCGGTDDLPAALQSAVAHGTNGRTLAWFQRYSGREEIVRAAARFFRANPGRLLADGELDAWLDTAGLPDPDLLVYAGGALELWDVLLWQGSYAEIWHTPDQVFSADDLKRAVADYRARQRRFGL